MNFLRKNFNSPSTGRYSLLSSTISILCLSQSTTVRPNEEGLGHALLTVVGFGMMVGSNDNAIKYAGAIIGVVGCQPNQAFLISYLQNNIVGTSKRAVASAMQIGGGAIGGIIASTVFRQADAPKYLPGLAVTLSMVSVMFLMLILFAIIMYKENKKLLEGKRGPIEGMVGFKYTL